MVVLGTIRSPPAFRDHVAVPDDHQAVHPLDLLVKCADQIQQRDRRNALRFGCAARQQDLIAACGSYRRDENTHRE